MDKSFGLGVEFSGQQVGRFPICAGYVLVWGQISYWALTVITNLATAIPLVGSDLLTALWGGEVLNAHSLGRFYCVHFLVPLAL